MECHVCGGKVPDTRYTRYKYKSTGRVYCSKQCSNKYRAMVSSRVMAETNRKYASERMKKNNPMTDPETKKKMIQTLKMKGHKPVKRGGNGQYTEQQLKIARALGWDLEVPIPTYSSPVPGSYPNSYKIDVANKERKIGIEVDGHSHTKKAKQKEDRKKTAVLKSLGWTILRFWNREIDQNLNYCLKKVREIL